MPRPGRRSLRRPITVLVLAAVLATTAAVDVAPAGARGQRGGSADTFAPVGTFDVMAGNGSAVAEIVDTTDDGRTLVYTDSPSQAIGFVDISDPAEPVGTGTLAVGGEPTSLVVADGLILVAVNTSASFTEPSGQLVVVDLASRQIVATHPLGGQPDSIALAPSGLHAAIVIENERDEDLNDGLIPQAPSGTLLIVDMWGFPRFWKPTAPQSWRIREANLAPVAAAATNGTDLEPEYVDINWQSEAVVSFQENNHLAVVSLISGRTIREFSAGTVDLSNVDTAEDDLISLDSSITRRREPDAVAWIDHDSFATANEGDYEDADGDEGGSRGFTVFRQNGRVEYESAESFEHALVAAGHYNEGRSENKGIEPEAVETAWFGWRNLLFVGSERSNAVGVYDVTRGEPSLLQVLPTGIGPEGLKAIPQRNLFVASTETDVADVGIPTMINIYALGQGPATYPGIASADDAAGNPIPWVALSGLAGDPADASKVYAVSDAFLAEGFVYSVDVSTTPATLTSRVQVTGASAALDLEGVAVGPDGTLWLGSEGDAETVPNLVLQVDPTTGAVLSEVALPASLVDQARSNGIEGIAVTGEAGAEVVHVAIQRAWPNEGDLDEVETKIGRYDVATGEWGFVHYPLQAEAGGDWIGLSELTLLPNGTFAVIERDKGWGPTTGFNAELKAVYGVDLAAAEFRAYDDPAGLVTVEKALLRDLVPDLEAASVWTPEKLEGLAVAADGQLYAVTDNDGVDDAPGETVFLRLGDWAAALGG